MEHLKQQAREQGVDPQRLHHLVSFDRFLARLFPDEHSQVPWLLKGGYAVELRLPGRARSTEDIDLLIPDPGILASSNPDKGQTVRDVFQEAANNDLHDRFTFRVGVPGQGLQGPPEGGFRFKVTTYVGSQQFCIFQLDVSLGDAVTGEPQWVTGGDWLGFAGLPGVAPARVAMAPIEQQFAEKLHALTLPRGNQENSRVQDLIDLVLFIESSHLDPNRVTHSLQTTFSRRRKHDLPVRLPPPPEEWRQRYSVLAAECGLNAESLEDGFEVVTIYYGQLNLS